MPAGSTIGAPFSPPPGATIAGRGAASLTARNRNQLTQSLTWLIAKHSAIVVRDLASGREMELPTTDLLKTGLTFSADGRLLYFLGGTESEPDHTDAALSDPELRPATSALGHARSSSFRRPESTRSANVAMTIAKMTTTIA